MWNCKNTNWKIRINSSATLGLQFMKLYFSFQFTQAASSQQILMYHLFKYLSMLAALLDWSSNDDSQAVFLKLTFNTCNRLNNCPRKDVYILILKIGDCYLIWQTNKHKYL